LGETSSEFGGSHLALVAGEAGGALAGSPAPGLPPQAPELYRALHRAMQAGLVRACHDLSEGGLAVSAAEMCLAGRLGAALTLDTPDPLSALFSESNGRLLVEVRPSDQAAFEALMPSLPARRVGVVTGGARLNIGTHDQVLISLTVEEILNAWRT
jgi:phosphoribosylformylglycinamidine synthase